MTEHKCRNCGEDIRPSGPGDGISEEAREYYAWVNERGGAICMTLVHEPEAGTPAVDWRAMFARYVELLEEREGIAELDGSTWTPEQHAAICELPGWVGEAARSKKGS